MTIYPLDGGELVDDYSIQRLVYKLNEIISVVNEIRAPQPTLGARQEEAMKAVLGGTKTIEEVATEYGVGFYDNVAHEFTSPVYCLRCEYYTQSLLDRLVLAADAPCDGCIHRAKWG